MHSENEENLTNRPGNPIRKPIHPCSGNIYNPCHAEIFGNSNKKITGSMQKEL
jgi:hypothetical protein